METKKQVTQKFIIGVVMIITSLVIGKVALIPLIIFPGDRSWQFAMLISYLIGWIILLIGIGLAGVEGYRLATHKYKAYKKKTIRNVKNHSKNAAIHVKKHSRNAARKVKKHTRRVTKGTAKVFNKDMKKSENTLRKTANKAKILKSPSQPQQAACITRFSRRIFCHYNLKIITAAKQQVLYSSCNKRRL